MLQRELLGDRRGSLQKRKTTTVRCSSDRGAVSSILKQLKELNAKETDGPVRWCDAELNGKFTDKEIQWLR